MLAFVGLCYVATTIDIRIKALWYSVMFVIRPLWYLR